LAYSSSWTLVSHKQRRLFPKPSAFESWRLTIVAVLARDATDGCVAT
jgi:hypothetical protein